MTDRTAPSTLDVRPTVPGTAAAAALVLDEALSFWGGVDPATGRVIDRNHPQFGAELGGAIVVMPHGRGSSSASSVLADMVRAGSAPAAIVLHEPDEIIALGSLAAEAVYGRVTPVVVCAASEAACIATGDHIQLDGATMNVTAPD